MDTLLGVAGDGYVIVAADASAARSILVFKTDQDKILALDDYKLLGMSGPNADCNLLGEYIQKNMTLYAYNNEMPLGTHAAAHYIRGELARALRKGPYQTNILLAGYDEKDGAALYFMDYLASLQKVGFGAQGYASNFCLSVFDRDYKEGLSFEEGLALIKKGIHELSVRFLISQPKFIIKVVDKNGIRIVE